MNTKQLTAIVESIVGKEKVSLSQRQQIKALFDTIVEVTTTAVKEKVVNKIVEEPNQIKDAPNEIPLQEASMFRFPSEVNVEIEGEGEPRKIKIFPDGISESVNNGPTN